MVLVGLTGGIGAGKSAVADLLARRGAAVIDADELAHEVMAPGGPAHAAVVERFGLAAVTAGGQIDRPALADVVFSDARARADLEAIVHPAVEEALRARVDEEAGTHGVVVAVVPLLAEVGWSGADAVIVVDCPDDVVVRRLVEGRGMDEADARRRMGAQATRAERLAVADRVIDNRGSAAALEAQVEAAWRWILDLPSPSGDAGGGPRRSGRRQKR